MAILSMSMKENDERCTIAYPAMSVLIDCKSPVNSIMTQYLLREKDRKSILDTTKTHAPRSAKRNVFREVVVNNTNPRIMVIIRPASPYGVSILIFSFLYACCERRLPSIPKQEKAITPHKIHGNSSNALKLRGMYSGLMI